MDDTKYLAKPNPGHTDGTLYRAQVVCTESTCKLEDSLFRAKHPDEAEARLAELMASYDAPVRGVLTRSDGAKPWRTIGEPHADAYGVPPCGEA